MFRFLFPYRSTLAFFIVFLFAFNVCISQAQPLVFLNWADYMDPQLIADFKARTGIEVKEIYFDSDEKRDELMAVNDGKGYVLILISGLSLGTYVKQGWLSPIPQPLNAKLSQIESRWWQAFSESKQYAVPYFWGTLGIAYRTDLVSEAITSWQQLFKPSPDIKGKISMIDSAREVSAMALKSLGYSMNSHNKDEFNQALALMKKQAPSVATYNLVNLDKTSSLLSGKVVAAMMYSGDALMLQEHSDKIRYVLPKEGGNIWIDYLSVSAHSKRAKEAWQFIYFLNEAKQAASLANFVYCASPNKSAWAHLSDEFLQNPTIFPSQKSLKNSEFFSPLPARQLKKLHHNFQKIVN